MASKRQILDSRQALNEIINIYQTNGHGGGKRIEIYAEGRELYQILDVVPPTHGPLLGQLVHRGHLIVAVPWPQKRRRQKKQGQQEAA